MLGGDNLFSRYIANRRGPSPDCHRRSSDFKNTSEYSRMNDPKLTALESKIESHQADTLKAITDVAKELHGLTVELRHDRDETQRLKMRLTH